MPRSANLLVNSTAKRILAVFDCPYAFHAEYPFSEFKLSKFIPNNNINIKQNINVMK